jgi:hypothetical protein
MLHEVGLLCLLEGHHLLVTKPLKHRITASLEGLPALLGPGSSCVDADGVGLTEALPLF